MADLKVDDDDHDKEDDEHDKKDDGEDDDLGKKNVGGLKDKHTFPWEVRAPCIWHCVNIPGTRTWHACLFRVKWKIKQI